MRRAALMRPDSRAPLRPSYIKHALCSQFRGCRLRRAGFLLIWSEPPVVQENIYRNFGMPTPNGYRKALRFMRHADKFGLPIVTFVDTPGAYAGWKNGGRGCAWWLGWA